MKNEIKLTFPPNGYAVRNCLFACAPAYLGWLFFFRSIKFKVPVASFTFANWAVLAVVVAAFLPFIILPLSSAFPQKFYCIDSEGIHKSLKFLLFKTAPRSTGWQEIQSLDIVINRAPIFSSTYYLCYELRGGKKFELMAAKTEAEAKNLKARIMALQPTATV